MDQKQSPPMSHHENPMQAVSTRFAIGTFIVIGILAFMYIRFFSSYSSSTSSTIPTQSMQREAVVMSPVTQRLATFSTPLSELTFEYPVEWYNRQEREGEWIITDSEASAEADFRLSIIETGEISSPEAILECTEDCEAISIAGSSFPVRTVQNPNGTVSRVIAIPAGLKGYMIHGTFDRKNTKGTQIFDTIYSTIITEN